MTRTGATPTQIQRAAQSAWEVYRSRYPSWEEAPDSYRRDWSDLAARYARHLVPDTAIIVDRADLARIVRRWFDPDDCDDDPTVDEAYERINAALKEPTT